MPIALPPSLAALESAARFAIAALGAAEAPQPVGPEPSPASPHARTPRAPVTLEGAATRLPEEMDAITGARPDSVALSHPAQVLAAYESGERAAALAHAQGEPAPPIIAPAWMPQVLRSLELQREVDPEAEHTSPASRADAPLRARFAIDSPVLGSLTVELRLAGTRLEVTVACADRDSRARVAASRAGLDVAMSLRGLRLAALEAVHGR